MDVIQTGSLVFRLAVPNDVPEMRDEQPRKLKKSRKIASYQFFWETNFIRVISEGAPKRFGGPQ